MSRGIPNTAAWPLKLVSAVNNEEKYALDHTFIMGIKGVRIVAKKWRGRRKIVSLMVMCGGVVNTQKQFQLERGHILGNRNCPSKLFSNCCFVGPTV